MMEALGTQLAGHFHVRVLGLDSGVWRWYGNQWAPSQGKAIGDGFRSCQLGLPQVIDRKVNLCCLVLKFCISFCSFELTICKVILSAEWIVLKSWCSFLREAGFLGRDGPWGWGRESCDSHKLEAQGWKRCGAIPWVWMPHLFWRPLPFKNRLLVFFLLVLIWKWQDIYQVADWATFFSVYSCHL